MRDEPTRRKQVLIVDDDPSVRAGLPRILASTEVEVATAESLEDAEAILDRLEIDLVLCDLRLSGLEGREGLELVSWVRDRRPKTAVLLMTAFGSGEIREEAFRLGAAAYWEKRRPIEELLQQVRALGIRVGGR